MVDQDVAAELTQVIGVIVAAIDQTGSHTPDNIHARQAVVRDGTGVM